jgi:hypothetical protein
MIAVWNGSEGEYKEMVTLLAGSDNYEGAGVEKLKPCKCGGNVNLKRSFAGGRWWYYCICPKCNKAIPAFNETKKEAIAFWNRYGEKDFQWR